MGSVNFLTEKLPVVGLKLYFLLSIAGAVLLTAVVIVIIFLRSRRACQQSTRVDHLSSGLITKEIAEIGGGNRAAELKKEGGGRDRSADEESGGGEGTVGARSVRVRVMDQDNIGWGRWYTITELEEATEGFSEENVIGEGGYGIVYRGVLPDHCTVAVKNLLNNK